ncbi:MAG: hypothetical protein U1F41_14920 [Burkholderiales bacterium]
MSAHPTATARRKPAAAASFAAWVAVLTVLACPAAAAGDATEISRAIELGQYSRASSLLADEVRKHPDNAAAWFDAGRVIAMMSEGTPPDDYCDADENWIFLALGHLSEAIRRDPAQMERLASSDSPPFSAFRKMPEFEYWRTAIDPLPASDAELREFFRKHPAWNRADPKTSVREALTLRPDGKVSRFASGRTVTAGTWKVERGELSIAAGSRTQRYPLTRASFALRGGTLRFPVLMLGREWTLGRILHDCAF